MTWESYIEIEFHEKESQIKTDKVKSITEKYKADALEKDEMVRTIKHDIDVVEMDVRKSNQLLHAEQELRLVVCLLSLNQTWFK